MADYKLRTMNELLSTAADNASFENSADPIPGDTSGSSSSKAKAYLRNMGFEDAVKEENAKAQTPIEMWRRRALFVEHVSVRLILLTLILIDVILVLVDLAISGKGSSVLEWIGVVFVTIFLVEILLRLFGMGTTVFFRDRMNLIDLIVVVVTFIATIITIAISSDEKLSRLAKLAVIGRLVRLPRLITLLRIIFTERKNLVRSSRKLVSENKRRYREGGYDLDLCYITERIIAMSFPSTGSMAYYRNPIEEVARFLDEFHKDNYKVYNMCRERAYDTRHFHGSVERFLVEDHNVPSLDSMMSFIESARKWLDGNSQRVVVVHCKGGKGRTGCMISALLMATGALPSAEDCLMFFGAQRTDYEKGKKFQGVETPSQNRYVGYSESVLKVHAGQLPSMRRLRLHKVRLINIRYIGTGDGQDWYFELFYGAGRVFVAEPAINSNCVAVASESDEKPGERTAELRLCSAADGNPSLLGDIKMRFYNRSVRGGGLLSKPKPIIPEHYESCAFFLWFHSAFIDQNNILRFAKDELDSLHKTHLKTSITDHFSLELEFTED